MDRTPSLDRGRLVATILYLRNQKEFYCHYMDRFQMVVEWLSTSTESQTAPIEDMIHDMCGCCGKPVYGRIPGGRCRAYCKDCHTKIPFAEQSVQYMWEESLADKLGVSPMVLESYIAEALWIIHTAHSRRQK